jgi:L-alanine-DL-glutamate epimerase-like enolase superfamily enzyme
MEIRTIRCTLVSYPLSQPLRPSWAPGRTFNATASTIVEVITDEGLTGVGALPHGDPIGLQTVANLVAPYLLGKDPFAVERISPILRNAARDGSYPWGVEMALWDIIGQACAQPVYRLWGGYQERIPAYASLAELPDAGEQIERLHVLQERGFRAFKLRLRRATIHEDVEVVRRVREAFGSEIDIMVDANQAHVMPSPGPHNVWSFRQALRVARAMEDFDVLWLEEPLPRYDYKQLSQLTRRVDLMIAGGELNLGLHEYRQLIDQDCYDIIQADAAFSEGLFQLRKVAAMAELAHKPFIPHTWSNGIGLGANLHLAAATPNCPWFEFPIDPPAWSVQARDFMLVHPYHVDEDGAIAVPDRPGLGLELDQEAIRTHTVERWESD